MKVEVISPKYGRHEVLIDEADAHLADSLYLHKGGQFLYPRLRPNKEYLHRAIMADELREGLVVDHKNRNTLDNRRANLHVVTIQENLRNQKRANNKTGRTGVAIAYDGKFSAQIKHNYKKIHLGVFSTIEEAIKARVAAEQKYWSA